MAKLYDFTIEFLYSNLRALFSNLAAKLALKAFQDIGSYLCASCAL